MSQEPHRLDDHITPILAAIERIQGYFTGAYEIVLLQTEIFRDAAIRKHEKGSETSKTIDRKFPDFLGNNS